MAFADEFMSNLLQNPNFYNPLYASNEQKKRQEDYAAMLAKRSTEGATRPTGVVAAMIDQLTSNIYRNASLNQEQAQYGDLQRRLTQQNTETQGGGGGYAPALMRSSEVQQPEPPQNVATGGSVPKMAAVQQAYSQGKNLDGTPSLNLTAGETPATVEQPANSTLSDDMIKQRLLAHGRRIASLGPAGGAPSIPPPGAPPPSPQSPAVSGGAAAPPNFAQRFTQAFPNSPGYSPANNAAIQVNPMATEQQRNVASGIFAPQQALSPTGQPIITSIAGGQQRQGVQPGIATGLQQRIEVAPGGGVGMPIFTPAEGNRGGAGAGITGQLNAIKPALDFSRQQGAESARVAGGSKAEGANIEQAVTQANSAREGIKNAGTMEDLIRSNPNQVFGPAAKSTNEFLRFVQSIPGVGASIDAKTLAASDGIEKLNLALAGSLQAKLGLNPSSIGLSMLSSPGNEKSYQGTLDLLGLVKQGFVRDHYIATTLYKKYQNNLADYPQAIDDYIHNNPIKSPNTGHLIMDPVPIQNPADEKKLGLKKGTPVLLPDGRHGWVP